MVIMLAAVGIVFGGIFGYKAFVSGMIKKSMSAQKMPPVTVTAAKAAYDVWRPEFKAVGSLRAYRGIDVTSEIAGLVRNIAFTPGEEVKKGQLLIQLNADADIALLKSLEAAADLAQLVYERDKKQYAIQAVSQAALDADAADLKIKKALAVQQAATVEKKAIHAPFAGRLGISTVNPGQYVNPGDKIVTLQALDLIYIDFYLPQQFYAQLSLNQKVLATTDTYPGRVFKGTISTINPKVDPDTRNIQVEAMFTNPKRELLPGMFASIQIQTGKEQRYLTLPQTAIAHNTYGETAFIIGEGGKGPDGKAILTVKQTFVTVGLTRGDQIAILNGIREGDRVVTSGQLKLRNGATVVINNSVQPGNDPAPKPVDQ
ncbi:MAG: efflux transporter periplasmic adaptor subunit [Deltaproteobacteria bacterium HGW-Deltaproteobacteria-13]|nr:MAG: efflux transporter periplasmic adaptor subunit [Deltaproteobacteria bacterium HGW-Deltaproteobacteria-13]